MGVELRGSRKVPVEASADLATADAFLDHWQWSGKANDSDVCAGNRVLVTRETVPFPKNAGEDQPFDALRLKSREQRGKGFKREAFSESIIRRLRMEVREAIDVEERMGDVSLFEDFHQLKSDTGLADAYWPGHEKSWHAHATGTVQAHRLGQRSGMSPEPPRAFAKVRSSMSLGKLISWC